MYAPRLGEQLFLVLARRDDDVRRPVAGNCVNEIDCSFFVLVMWKRPTISTTTNSTRSEKFARKVLTHQAQPRRVELLPGSRPAQAVVLAEKDPRRCEMACCRSLESGQESASLCREADCLSAITRRPHVHLVQVGYKYVRQSPLVTVAGI